MLKIAGNFKNFTQPQPQPATQKKPAISANATATRNCGTALVLMSFGI
jgi:hypothetical protein